MSAQQMVCRFCGKVTAVLPSRTDPANLHTLITRCGDCYKTHPEHITVIYQDINGNRLPEPQ